MVNTNKEFFAKLAELRKLLPKIEGIPKDSGGAAFESAAIGCFNRLANGRVLEFGSGTGKGTWNLAKNAKVSSVLSIDHLLKYTEQATKYVTTARAAAKTSQNTPVECKTFTINKDTGFYDVIELVGKFDTIVIDGPPGTEARMMAIDIMLPFLAQDGIILLDDARRDSKNVEASCDRLNIYSEMLHTNCGMALISRTKLNDETEKPTTPERTFWRGQSKEFYVPMVARHTALWDRVDAILREREIQSVYEIGCGLGHLAPNYPKYHGIDVNPQARVTKTPNATFETGDFLTTDLDIVRDKYDAVVACGVIEHVSHWNPFMSRVLDINSSVSLVSFFASAKSSRDFIRPRAKAGRKTFWENSYYLPAISSWLRDLDINFTWEHYPHAVGTDCLLIISN